MWQAVSCVNKTKQVEHYRADYCSQLQFLLGLGKSCHSTLLFNYQLPTTKQGHDSMVVFVDKLSKMVHIVPTTVTLTAPQLAVMFFKEVVQQTQPLNHDLVWLLVVGS